MNDYDFETLLQRYAEECSTQRAYKRGVRTADAADLKRNICAYLDTCFEQGDTWNTLIEEEATIEGFTLDEIKFLCDYLQIVIAI